MGRGMHRRELSKKGGRAGPAEGAVSGLSLIRVRTCSRPVQATDAHCGTCSTTLDGAEGHGY